MEQEKAVQAVLEAVCRVCGVTPEALRQRSRREPLPTARALAAHFLHQELRLAPRRILPLIGYPAVSRTTIYHYLGRRTLLEERAPFRRDWREKAEQIRQELSLDC